MNEIDVQKMLKYVEKLISTCSKNYISDFSVVCDPHIKKKSLVDKIVEKLIPEENNSTQFMSTITIQEPPKEYIKLSFDIDANGDIISDNEQFRENT
jgi:hypothetical protein